MTKTVLLACAVAAAAALAVPARAETSQLYASGLWSAYGGTTDDNRQVCGITTVGPDGRRIAIQQFDGDSGLDFQLVKSSWAIPDNTPIDLSIQFDTGETSPAKAVGSGNRVVLSLPFDQSVPFMRALRGGSQIHVYFPGGNEPGWTGGLRGTGNVINAFNDCRSHFPPPEPTQPFQPPAAAPGTPTQPFSSAPVAPPPPAPGPVAPAPSPAPATPPASAAPSP